MRLGSGDVVTVEAVPADPSASLYVSIVDSDCRRAASAALSLDEAADLAALIVATVERQRGGH